MLFDLSIWIQATRMETMPAELPAGPLRVAINVDELFGRVPGGGGHGWVITQLIAHLAAIDPHTRYTLFSARRIRALPEPIAALPWNFRLVQLPAGLRGEWLHFAWHALRRPAVERWLGPQDVVHATTTAAVPAVRSARLVVTVHDLIWWRFPAGPNWAGRYVHRTGLRIAAREAAAIAARPAPPGGRPWRPGAGGGSRALRRGPQRRRSRVRRGGPGRPGRRSAGATASRSVTSPPWTPSSRART